jgi:hypothetical protein
LSFIYGLERGNEWMSGRGGAGGWVGESGWVDGWERGDRWMGGRGRWTEINR